MPTTTQSDVIERPLPSNLDAERSVLGAVLLDNAALDDALVLKPEDFSLDQHRRIFSMYQQLREQNEAIDLVTLMEGLQRRGDLEDAGGTPYVASLADGIPKVSNIGHYVRIVRDKSLRRQLIHASHMAKEIAFEDAASAESILDRAAQTILDLAIEAAMPDSTGKTYREAAFSFLRSLDEPSTIRVYSGLTDLDKTTGGFRAGELVTVTAGTGVGKTLFAQQIRRLACSHDLHGLYYSGEMTAEHLSSRELATAAGIEPWKMRRPERLSKEERERLILAAGKECQKCTILNDGLSIQKIRIAARRKKRATGLELLVLDYDELIDASGRDEIEQQRYVIRSAKALAMELRICVIVISQLRKSLDKDEAKKPTLERIYGSGAKSKHSSWIIFVDREYVRDLKGDETEGRVCILKARDGRTGEIPVKFNVQSLVFQDKPKLGDTEPKQSSRVERRGSTDES